MSLHDVENEERRKEMSAVEEPLGLPAWSSRAREQWEDDVWDVWQVAAGEKSGGGDRT